AKLLIQRFDRAGDLFAVRIGDLESHRHLVRIDDLEAEIVGGDGVRGLRDRHPRGDRDDDDSGDDREQPGQAPTTGASVSLVELFGGRHAGRLSVVRLVVPGYATCDREADT